MSDSGSGPDLLSALLQIAFEAKQCENSLKFEFFMVRSGFGRLSDFSF
jgi:hypothetical protein